MSSRMMRRSCATMSSGTCCRDTGMLLNLFEDFGRAEAACRKATDIDPSHAKSWRVLAEAILRQEGDARLS